MRPGLLVLALVTVLLALGTLAAARSDGGGLYL
jgi:hypothetical protein